MAKLYSPKMYEYVIVQVAAEKKKKQQQSSLFEQAEAEESTTETQKQSVYKIVGFSAKDGTFQLEADPIEDPSMKFLTSKFSWIKANQLKPAPVGHRTWTDADVRRLWKSA